ncbi:auxin-responsive protein IAA27-like isoform X2 [Chenopodium quinoa]|uniref:auxin-responsive protein IAA27-like isoform X2 n=1 Tax=Chenopodium quinoa TaxID=63459 RepID=UPI000B78D751|nr:auxin-responsive protein IAA27-like isoform X2 [Chenopodium quinoa]
MSRVFEEHDYIGLSEVSSIEDQTSDKSKNSAFSDKNNTKILNFKATELRLGLPGSQSSENGDDDNDKNGDDFNYKVAKLNSLVSGAKRGFSDAINGASNNWGSSENGGSNDNSVKNEEKKMQNSPVSVQPANSVLASSKAQVVGWPPIRSFRKNSMAINTPKTNESNKDSKSESGCHFVKVSMDGAPYLRKINLGTYGGYVELSSALEKMFSGFTVGHVDFSKGRLMDNLRHSEYVLTYEDKDGDWMLVGDVPWNMFLETCRRLRIMKSSDAVGLASRASEE